MKITALEKTGNSSKYEVVLSKQRGTFMISLSYTLCKVVWQITTDEQKLEIATRMAEAIVGRHDPRFPFKSKYIFGDHNSKPTPEQMIDRLKKFVV